LFISLWLVDFVKGVHRRTPLIEVKVICSLTFAENRLKSSA
jgi:hypothetical protein